MSKFNLMLKIIFLHTIVVLFLISCNKTNTDPPSARFTVSKNVVKYSEEFTLTIDDYNETYYYKWEPEYSLITIDNEGNNGEYIASFSQLGTNTICLTAINEYGAESSCVDINVSGY